MLEERLNSQPENALAAALFVAVGVKESDGVRAAEALGPRADAQCDDDDQRTEEKNPKDE